MLKLSFKALMLVSLLFMYSCQSNEDGTNAINSSKDSKSDYVKNPGISGKLLANIDLSEGQFVSFWEAEPGVVLIRHAQPVEIDNVKNQRISIISNKLDQLVKDGKSFVEIYNAIALSPKSLELKSLGNAYKNQIALKSKFLNNKPADIKQSSQQTSNARVEACTPDYYNDNYGANWFLQNFCVEGNFRWCPTNVTWADTGLFYSTWFKTSTMAPDFATGCRTRGWYWNGSATVLNWDYTVLPRYVETHYFTGGGYRQSRADGFSACARVHLSKLHNN